MRKYRTVAIPIEVFNKLKQIADQEGRSYARQISWMIKNYSSDNTSLNQNNDLPKQTFIADGQQRTAALANLLTTFESKEGV